ncbi:MAG TPA: SprT family zinc-dependent metalloprotease [Methanospirillum sp.]|nr:SprT family zinc-dependent metalloprotease [Methanospirillum sp.]
MQLTLPDNNPSIFIQGEEIPYSVIKKPRVKRITLKITAEKRLQVIIPLKTDDQTVHLFVTEQKSWVSKHLCGIDHTKKTEEPARFLNHDGYQIPYHIQFSRRASRLMVKITADRMVIAVAPQGTAIHKIQQFIEDKADWIIKKAVKSDRVIAPQRQYQNGDLLPFYGEDICLVKKYQGNETEFDVTGKTFTVSLPESLTKVQESAFVRHKFECLCQRRLSDIADKLVPIWSTKLGIQQPLVRFGNQRSKWGVCTPNGIILNIRLAMAPLQIIEYVIVHELCHIIHRNHSKEYWSLVSRSLPHYLESEKALKRDGGLYTF